MTAAPAPPALEPFLLLAKSARGKAAADLIRRATSEPGLFVFGELLDAPGIKEVCGGGVGGFGL
jgi:COP9 signalosome complex subunit 7